jgi:hypothetical protein
MQVGGCHYFHQEAVWWLSHLTSAAPRLEKSGIGEIFRRWASVCYVCSYFLNRQHPGSLTPLQSLVYIVCSSGTF